MLGLLKKRGLHWVMEIKKINFHEQGEKLGQQVHKGEHRDY